MINNGSWHDKAFIATTILALVLFSFSDVGAAEKDATSGAYTASIDHALPSGMDPTYQWHTFYGSNNFDLAAGMATDADGNVFIAGQSWAAWNGPAGQAPLHAYTLEQSSFIIKLDSNGIYQWHTFLGSGITDIKIDGSGNIYVTGSSYAGWNGPAAQPPLHAFSGWGLNDCFVLKLNSSGTYQWHTFYGSTSEDRAGGIAIDSVGNVFVAGQSTAGWNGPAGQLPLTPCDGDDLFILKLNSSGTYQWHAFYGSYDLDTASGITIDGSGNVYVSGNSRESWNGPGGQVPLYDPFNGYVTYNAVVLKLDNSGAYKWHTFYGAGSLYEDFATGIAVDGIGNAYVTGSSGGSWSGPGGQPPLHDYSGHWGDFTNYDLFVLKLNTDGTYQWHTFYGSGSNDEGAKIALTGSENVYVTGYSDYTWSGPAGQTPSNAFVGAAGYSDIFILKLNGSGSYQRHSFYGSVSDDGARGMAIDRSGYLYVTGYSGAGWNGPDGQAPLNAFVNTATGYEDIFVLKLSDQGGQGGNVRILRSGTPLSYHATLHDAYNAATDGDVIQAQAIDLTEALTCSSNIIVSLIGGYDSVFAVNTGMTTLTGNITIGTGTVTIENLVIK